MLCVHSAQHWVPLAQYPVFPVNSPQWPVALKGEKHFSEVSRLLEEKYSEIYSVLTIKKPSHKPLMQILCTESYFIREQSIYGMTEGWECCGFTHEVLPYIVFMISM